MKNKQVKVKTPAKINLTLEIENKREDGFHNIKSIMQTIDIFDFLTISAEIIKSEKNIIELSGNSDLIPYDSSNLIYKAAEKFLEAIQLQNTKIKIYLEKNIPIAAGLAGGSSDAAGTLVGLNKLFDNVLPMSEIHNIAAQLGSDLNFCIEGGVQLATSRGEILTKTEGNAKLKFIVVKPKNLSVATKEAYGKYAALKDKPQNKKTDKMMECFAKNPSSENVAKLLNNEFETVILKDYPLIKQVKDKLIQAGCLNAIMSGSGPTVFGVVNNNIKVDFDSDFEVFYSKSINYGSKVVD